MNKLLLAAVGLATAAGLAVQVAAGAGQAPQPGAPKPEPFTIPVAPPGQSPAPPAYLPTTPGFQKLPLPPQPAADVAGGVSRSTATAFPQTTNSADKTSFLSQLCKQDFDEPDPNQDIAVQPSCGNWMICVNWYSGSEAPKEARAMVLELRSNPAYRLNAYVFTKGAEERKAELKRIEELKKLQREQLAKVPDLPPDTHILIPYVRSHFEMQCAVLVGGYKDMESARRALDQLRKLKPPDPSRVKIATEFVFKLDANGKAQDGEHVPINPFARALVVANPSLPPKPANAPSAEDLGLLKKLNAAEEYSLLNCPKKYTLAVKQFALPVLIQPSNSSTSVMDKQAMSGDTEDRAGVKAHVLAHMLRKDKLEAYVLHTKYSSFVTVGSYDSPNDPRLKRDQEWLPQYINKELEKVSPQLVESIKIMASPAVMEVPN